MGRPGVAAASALGSVGCAAGVLGVKQGDRKQVAKDRCQAGQQALTHTHPVSSKTFPVLMDCESQPQLFSPKP